MGYGDSADMDGGVPMRQGWHIIGKTMYPGGEKGK
jgi:hypothetical protein